MSLLEDALKAPVKASQKRGASADEVELAVAFFHGRVSSAQAAKALKQDKAFGISAWAQRVLTIALAEGTAILSAVDPDTEFDDSKEPPAPVLARKAVR